MKRIKFEDLDAMDSIEFIGIKWKKIRNQYAEVEFGWKNFTLHIANFAGSDVSINATLVMSSKSKNSAQSWDVQETWGKTVNEALKNLKIVINQIAKLASHQ